MKLIDLIGMSFGQWTVIDRGDHASYAGRACWLCACTCGHKQVIDGYFLRKKGHTVYCLGHQRKANSRKEINYKHREEKLKRSLSALSREINTRRKKNHDDYSRHRWNPESISKRLQSDLLDWIEGELRSIIAGKQHSYDPAQHPHSGKKEENNVISENQGRGSSIDAGIGP